jgi:tRNA A37 N6-isopentenylltransferase MiaA
MAESDSDAREDEDEDEEVVEEVKRSRKQKRQVIRQKWDEIEMKEIEQYFRSYLDAKVCPRKKAVELAKKQSKNRNGKIWRRTNDKIVKKISALNHKK